MMHVVVMDSFLYKRDCSGLKEVRESSDVPFGLWGRLAPVCTDGSFDCAGNDHADNNGDENDRLPGKPA